MKNLIRSCCLLILLPVFAAQAEPARVALVIGNAAYKEGALKNPVNDARDMKKALELAGFSVTLMENADLKQMKEAVRGFGHRLNADSIGLFYFSGHGVRNDDGQNYLLPVGDSIQSDAELEYEAMNGSFVLDVMRKSGSKTNLVFLDACRNNPLKYASGRSLTRGLATMDKRGGVLISYATGPGQVARDGNGRNSPYTASLIKWMREPLTLESMLKRVANEVADATGNKQTPWYDTSLMADFYFTAPTEKQTAQSSESKLVSPQGTPIEQFKIDEKLIQSYPELIALIINTESMEDDERQYWFDIMPSMDNRLPSKLSFLRNLFIPALTPTPLPPGEGLFRIQALASVSCKIVVWKDVYCKFATYRFVATLYVKPKDRRPPCRKTPKRVKPRALPNYRQKISLPSTGCPS